MNRYTYVTYAIGYVFLNGKFTLQELEAIVAGMKCTNQRILPMLKLLETKE